MSNGDFDAENATREQLSQALDDWLDGKAVDESVKARWLEDQQLSAIYLAASQVQQRVKEQPSLEVPHWDAESTFVSRGETWQQKLLSWFNPSPRLSMVFSIAALMMVIFKVELQIDDGKMTIAFAGDSQASLRFELEQQFEQRLVAYSRDQQILIANYFDDIQAKQQQDVTQLASYLINASRQERKEDIGAVVNYFNQQRDEDLNLNQQQLNQVVYQMQQQQGWGSNVRRVNMQQFDNTKEINSNLSTEEEQ